MTSSTGNIIRFMRRRKRTKVYILIQCDFRLEPLGGLDLVAANASCPFGSGGAVPP